MSNIIDGKKISNKILLDLKNQIILYASFGRPCLAVIQVGCSSQANLYIKKKREACLEIGMECKVYNFDLDIIDNKLCKLIDELNKDINVHGIIIQLPLPHHLNESEILNKIAYEKDVDGFNSQNIGELAMEKYNPLFIPCTPLGCMEILYNEDIDLLGKNVVIIGKSNIVGLPMALLLLKAFATVTVCHIHTKNIKQYTKNADIIISACGQPEMINRDWIKEGVIIIDIGINYIEDNSKKSGKKLVGDVDFNEVKDIAYKITPVPGGIGPMTVAMLLSNTFLAFKNLNMKKVDSSFSSLQLQV